MVEKTYLSVKEGSALAFKGLVRSVAPKICLERALLVTKSFRETECMPPVRRRALALKRVLKNMTIFLSANEVIAGNLASDIFAAPLFPEYAIDWFEQEMDSIPSRPMDRFTVPENAREVMRPVFDYWRGRTFRDKCMEALPESMKEADRVRAIYGEHLINEGSGHLTVDFAKVLSAGLRGVSEEAAEALSKLEVYNGEQVDARDFLEAVGIVTGAVRDFAGRYAHLAEDMASHEADAARANQLRQIAKICRKVPWEKAETFSEALQSVWFVQLVLQIESNGHSVSLGRFDQYLYPFYARDVAQGRLTRSEAKELVEHFWVKLNTINKVRPWSDTEFLTGYPMFQNVTIGGRVGYGRDAVNDLTYICLEATEELAMTQPSLSARYDAASSHEYLAACMRCVKRGLGMPAMFNDDVIVPALLNRGVCYRDAEDYAMVGCVEVSIPGKWGYRCNGMSYFNLMKLLELTLNDGKDPITGICLMPGNGKLTDFDSFEALWQAWWKQAQWYTQCYVQHDAIVDSVIERFMPEPFCSALVNDCIKRGKTIMAGGAVYDVVSAQSIGLANLSNAMAALKKLCYDAKRVSRTDMMAALAGNFETEQGKAIRRMILEECPKYGNDDDYVDDIAARIMGDCAQFLENSKNTRYGRGPINCGWQISTSTVTSNVPFGASVGATPDGRKAGQSLAEGCSPVQGTDVRGPTASMNSIAKLPNVLISGGQLYNMKFSTSSFETQTGIRAMIQLLRGYARGRGWHVQFNVIDAGTLLDAQAHPENYRDLVVRVAGYSAYFVDLNRTIQDDIIRRTEHVFV